MSGRKTSSDKPCPCGSRRTFRNCCLLRAAAAGAPGKFGVPAPVADLLRRATKFGHVRPAVHATWRAKKWVAVGNELLSSANWKTFHDFLFDHLIDGLGPDWYRAETAKPVEERHIIVQWYEDACRSLNEHFKNSIGVKKIPATGTTAAYLLLAYDIYLLRHHQSLRSELLGRIKRRESFQGARYEAFAAASCIRAGFAITYEDEVDKTRRHPEFQARRAGAGEVVWIEAKSRHREGVLGRSGVSTAMDAPQAGVERLLRSAIEKRPGTGRFVVFVDVNLPSQPVRFDQGWCREVLDAACKRQSPEGTDPFDAVFFTNHPSCYYRTNTNPPSRALVLFGKQWGTEPAPELLALFAGVQQYGNVPLTFEEAA